MLGGVFQVSCATPIVAPIIGLATVFCAGVGLRGRGTVAPRADTRTRAHAPASPLRTGTHAYPPRPCADARRRASALPLLSKTSRAPAGGFPSTRTTCVSDTYPASLARSTDRRWVVAGADTRARALLRPAHAALHHPARRSKSAHECSDPSATQCARHGPACKIRPFGHGRCRWVRLYR